MDDQEGFAIALEEAKISFEEGGVPVLARASSLDNLSRSDVARLGLHSCQRTENY